MKNIQTESRRRRNRAKLFGTSERPRLSVFRSNRYTYTQLIDDSKKRTIVAVSTQELKGEKQKKVSQAEKIGELLAERAKKAGVTAVVFNKGAYKYHGRVKAVAEGARKGGLKL